MINKDLGYLITKLRLLDKVLSVVPPLGVKGTYKGKNGRMCVIGGSQEYTGAPYFAGMSILYSGGDLSQIICEEKAFIAIKSYSPDLIVYPFLAHKGTSKTKKAPNSITSTSKLDLKP